MMKLGFLLLLFGPLTNALFLNFSPLKNTSKNSLDLDNYTCIPWIFNPGCYFNKFINWDLVCRTNTLGWEQCDVLKGKKKNVENYSIGKSETNEIEVEDNIAMDLKMGYPEKIDFVSMSKIDDEKTDLVSISPDVVVHIDNGKIENEEVEESNRENLDLVKEAVDSVSPDIIVHIGNMATHGKSKNFDSNKKEDVTDQDKKVLDEEEVISPDVVEHIRDLTNDEKSDSNNLSDNAYPKPDDVDIKGLPSDDDDDDFKRGFYQKEIRDNPELDMDQEENIEFDA